MNNKLLLQIKLLYILMAFAVSWSMTLTTVYTLKANALLPVVLIGSLKFLFNLTSIIASYLKFVTFRASIIGLFVFDLILVLGCGTSIATGRLEIALYADIVTALLSGMFGILYCSHLKEKIAKLDSNLVRDIDLFNTRVSSIANLSCLGIGVVLAYYLKDDVDLLCRVILYVVTGLGVVNLITSLKAIAIVNELEKEIE